MIPLGFEIWNLSRTGTALFGTLAVLGLGVGIWQSAIRWHREARIVACVLCALSIAAHALVVAVLRIDANRNSGRVPLSEPFASIAPMIAIGLFVLAPLLGGWLFGRSVRRALADSLALPTGAAQAAVAAYAIYISPWVATIVLD